MDYKHQEMRARGANDMMSSAKRTIIMARLERRRFVSRVDYITSPGYIDGLGTREKSGLNGGGPVAVITDKAVFRFCHQTKEMYLDSIYPGVSVEEVMSEVSWPLRKSQEINVVEPPTVDEVEFIRRYDPTDVILRARRKFYDISFFSWFKLVTNTWTSTRI